MSSFRKTHDLAVRTGSYTDREGKEKGRYENVGHVLEGGDGQRMLCLKRTFNPAGVPNPDGRDTVILSTFEVRENEGRQSVPAQASRPAGQPSRGQQRQQTADFDDDIPFAFAVLAPLAAIVAAAAYLAGGLVA